MLLVVEDEPHYARLLADQGHALGFKVLVAQRGSEALELTRRFMPAAITLDLYLPDMLGWAVLGELKRDPSTRHVPVQIISLEEDSGHRLARGAFGFTTKTTSTEAVRATLQRLREYTVPRRKRLLLVSADEAERDGIADLFGHEHIDLVAVADSSQAVEALRDAAFDCVVVDLSAPDMPGSELLLAMRDEGDVEAPPVVVLTSTDPSPEEEERLRQLSRGLVLKEVRSRERLLDRDGAAPAPRRRRPARRPLADDRASAPRRTRTSWVSSS